MQLPKVVPSVSSLVKVAIAIVVIFAIVKLVSNYVPAVKSWFNVS